MDDTKHANKRDTCKHCGATTGVLYHTVYMFDGTVQNVYCVNCYRRNYNMYNVIVGTVMQQEEQTN